MKTFVWLCVVITLVSFISGMVAGAKFQEYVINHSERYGYESSNNISNP